MADVQSINSRIHLPLRRRRHLTYICIHMKKKNKGSGRGGGDGDGGETIKETVYIQFCSQKSTFFCFYFLTSLGAEYTIWIP